MSGWLHDLSQAMRRIARHPGNRVAIAATLALGIGANAAIFGAGDALRSGAPRLSAPAELAILQPQYRRPDGSVATLSSWSYPLWRGFAEATAPALASVAYTASPVNVNLGGVGESARARVEIVSGNYFDVLGAPAASGRAVSPGDDTQAETAEVAVLTDALAQRHFGSSAAAVGKTIRLNDRPFTVVGVMPAGFHGLSERAELWIPMAAAPAITFANRLRGSLSFWHQVAVRDAGDADALRSTIATGMRGAAEQVPMAEAFGAGELDAQATRWLEQRRDPALERSLWILRGAVVALFLLALLNAGHLALAGAIVRSREHGVRLALGASRVRLGRLHLIEAALLGLAAGAAGLVAGQAMSSLLARQLDPQAAALLQPEGIEHAGIWLATAAATLVAGLAIGLAVAIRAGRGQPFDALRQLPTGGSRLGRWRAGAIGLQAALAVVLLIGAGLALRGAQRVLDAPLGFDPDRTLGATIALPNQRASQADGMQVFERVLDGVRAIPGVQAVALANCMPLSDGCDRVQMTVRGRPRAEGEPGLDVQMNMVDGGWFGTLRVPLLSGRAIADGDAADAPRVAVVSAEAARRYWPDADPLGARIQLSVGWGEEDDWAEVVGVAGDVTMNRAGAAPEPLVYLSWRQYAYGNNTILLRTPGDAAMLAAPLRAALRAADPDLPAYDVATLSERVAAASTPQRGLAALGSAFALLALLLAAAGTHGMLAFFVARRTRELGVRAALGASQRQVGLELLRQAARPLAAGGLAGLAVALAIAPPLARHLELPTAVDAVVVASAIACLAVALALAVVPALVRAWHVQPMQALRQD